MQIITLNIIMVVIVMSLRFTGNGEVKTNNTSQEKKL